MLSGRLGPGVPPKHIGERAERYLLGWSYL